MSDHQIIPIELIDDPQVLLRRIDMRSMAYLEVKDSVDSHGVLNSILVRPKGDRYEVCDGFVRLTVSRELRRKDIPAIVRDVSDEELLVLQLQANACRVETKPVEYARRIKQLLELSEDVTLSDICVMCSKSQSWVKDQLRLLRLTEDIQKYVDNGSLPVGNAYWLARLPEGYQQKFLNDALTLPIRKFSQLAGAKVKELRENRVERKLEEDFGIYKPRPYLRPLARIREETLTPIVAPIVCEAEGATTAVEGFRAALMWVMQSDKCSLRGRQRKRAEKFHLQISEEEDTE